MSETDPSLAPEAVESPSKKLGDRVADFFAELEKIIKSTSREEVQAGSNAAQQRLREIAEKEDNSTRG